MRGAVKKNDNGLNVKLLYSAMVVVQDVHGQRKRGSMEGEAAKGGKKWCWRMDWMQRVKMIDRMKVIAVYGRRVGKRRVQTEGKVTAFKPIRRIIEIGTDLPTPWADPCQKPGSGSQRRSRKQGNLILLTLWKRRKSASSPHDSIFILILKVLVLKQIIVHSSNYFSIFWHIFYRTNVDRFWRRVFTSIRYTCLSVHLCLALCLSL